MVKSPAEIDTIRRSVNLNSEAFARVLKRIRPGVRELDVAAEIEFQMKMLGAEKASFDTIIAAGPHSALPHSHPTAHRLANNELLLIDMGASLEGYASDMTRVIHLGPPSKKIREMYRAVLEAQLAGIDAVREGTAAGKVDAATRGVLKKYKLDKHSYTQLATVWAWKFMSRRGSERKTKPGSRRAWPSPLSLSLFGRAGRNSHRRHGGW